MHATTPHITCCWLCELPCADIYSQGNHWQKRGFCSACPALTRTCCDHCSALLSSEKASGEPLNMFLQHQQAQQEAQQDHSAEILTNGCCRQHVLRPSTAMQALLLALLPSLVAPHKRSSGVMMQKAAVYAIMDYPVSTNRAAEFRQAHHWLCTPSADAKCGQLLHELTAIAGCTL